MAKISRKNIAAQLYTLRDFLKTPQEIAASLKKVKKIGFTAVQDSGMGPIAPAELRRMLDGEGLTCCATHEDSAAILEKPESLISKLQALGCTQTAYPYPGGIDFSTVESVKAFAKKLDQSGEVFAKAGMRLSYHNHHIEFRRVGGRPVLEIIYAETSPRFLLAELDTYWVQAGGGCPADWCERMSGRLPLLHLKDFTINAETQPEMTEIGNGNINWKKTLAAADKAGCEWYIVEQDTAWRNNDPFESLRISYEFIINNLCA